MASAQSQQTWLSWLVSTNDVHELWNRQPTYILSQAHFVLAGVLTLIHAFKQGGRWPWYWFACVLHGLWTDNIWHFLLPNMDNFWHSQTPLMLLGNRLPFHIVLVYPVFMYWAAMGVSRLRLPLVFEMAAVGLLTVAVDLPYDIVSVKFVHWTWHATDPNIYDRFYHVPWNSLYFHATFAASFYGIFHGLRSWLAPNVQKWQSAGFKTELRTLLVTAIFSMPGGVVMFAVIYHPLHDSFGVHSEVTFWAIASLFITITVIGVLNHLQPVDQKKSRGGASKLDWAVFLQILIHYGLYWSFAVWGSPESEVSTGLHQTVGPCEATESLVTPFGQTLWKGKYLCIEDHDETYFDFHCVGNQIPRVYSSVYTICGTPFENRAEYVTVVTAVSFFSLLVIYALIKRGADNFDTARYVKTKRN